MIYDDLADNAPRSNLSLRKPGLDVSQTYAQTMKFAVNCVWFIINDVLVTTKELQSGSRKLNDE